jgi:mRNA-degrading endonuclease toxin of MazEF toxin-antitoxin module
VGAPAAGAVVLVRFPFSDLSRSKLRPAVVLADAGRGDAVLCQVTSKSYGDQRAVTIATTDLATGSLRVTSFARPGKIFTANEAIITTTVGSLTPETLERVINAVVQLLRPENLRRVPRPTRS